MNKFGVVLGVAAVATLAGCKDPDYKYATTTSSQAEATPVATVEQPAAPTCKCPPGTKHALPCLCGAPDCRCIVETKPLAEVPAAPAAPEYSIYVVQNGDYLAKISKRFNVKIDTIRKLNPSIKKNVVRVGQKLKLPGTVDVGVQAAPVAATAAKPAAAKKAAKKASYAPYAGATKEYVVKSGDTLGSIAYGNGLSIRQIKELNGLSSNVLKVGQKLKIPAEKVGKKAAPAPAKAAEAAPAAPAEAPKAAEAAAAPETPAAPAAPAAAEAASAAPATPASPTYVVQEGEDMTSVSISWGVSAAQIRELNNLGENDQLVPGQIIKLPADAQR